LEWARDWLISHAHLDPDFSMGLIWDCYSVHRKQEVVNAAANLGIMLGFIPAGQTSTLQPLDRRLFGILKQKAIAMWRKCKRDDARIGIELDRNIVWAIYCLASQWHDVTREQVLAAWEHLVEYPTAE
jgi:hypothetical protein